MCLYCLKILLAFYSFGVGVGQSSGAVTVFLSVLKLQQDALLDKRRVTDVTGPTSIYAPFTANLKCSVIF